MLYSVHDGSSGYAYYVSPRPGQYVAASVRQEVSHAIADFLNNLPAGISPEEVLQAIGLGRPHGALRFPETWKNGQIWPADSAAAQKKAIHEHRREVKGGWSPRPEILNS